MRMFFALWPDALTRAQVANAVAVLRLTDAARPVPQQNYHVTLAFVGDVPISSLVVLRQIGLGQRGSTCTIRLDTYEHCRNRKSSQPLRGRLRRRCSSCRRDCGQRCKIIERKRPGVRMSRSRGR